MIEPLRVLILEDSPVDAELVQFELEEAGIAFAAKVVMTEGEFINELQACSYDLILSDYDLPTYNGALALQEAKRRCPDVPFILVTGAVSEERAIHIFTGGAKDYVMKNRLSRLVPAVKRVLAEVDEIKARKRAEEDLRRGHAELEAKVKERTAALEAEIQVRKRVEETLRRESQILAQVHDAIIAVDLEGRITLWNKGAERLYGYIEEEAIGRMVSILYFEEDLSILEEQVIAPALAAGKHELDVRCRNKSGQLILIHLSLSLLHDENGSACGLIGYSMDITERKQTEEALRESNARLKKVLEAEAVGVMFWDLASGCMTDANDTFLKMMGYNRREVEARELTWQKLTPPEFIELSLAEIRKFQATGRVGPYEKEYFRKDGTRQWLIFAGSSLGGDTCVEFCVDISDRKHTEAALHASEAKYRSLFNSIDEGFCIIEVLFDEDERAVDYRFLEVNPSFERQTGLANACGRTVREMVPAHEEFWFEIYGRIARIGKPVRFEHEAAQLGRWYDVYAWHYGAPQDKQVAVLFNDITERKRAEEALKERTRQLEVANKELESFSYSVSHDLRAPLRAIDGYARMILRNGPDRFDAETARQFQNIRDNSQKMGNLIDDILAFSRIGTQNIKRKKLDMEGLVREVWQEILAAHSGRKPVLKNSGLPPAHGDRALIRQVHSNLLGNAVKFTQTRDEALIETGSETRGGERIYYVRDNGVGFDMAHCGKLFGVFQRLHSDEKYKGTGIGLALVKRIIDRHGGRVWAEGEVDKGATFYFTLPTP